LATPARTIADLMSTPVLTAEPTELISEAAARMLEHRVGSVVVVDGGRPVGILTEHDLVRFSAKGEDGPTKVVELMSPDPFTLGPDVEVVDAWNTIAEKGYRHIPVVDGAELVGLISLTDLVAMAQIRSMGHPSLVEAPKGLEGVVVAETAVGDVRGQEGFYHYRHYNAVELAGKRSLEDVWYLLFNGELPDGAQRAGFLDEVRPLSAIPDAVKPLLPDIARAGGAPGPLDALRTAMSAVSQALDMRPSMDLTADERRGDALRICAVTPTLIMALHRLRNGLDPLEPRPDLGYSANYLYLLTGEVPDPDHARAVEQYQISTIDHGFNASTFTARVVTSTGADLGSATVAAIGALSGPLHGGAPSRALDMLDAIGTPDKAEEWIRGAVNRGERIMGFGHRVYKTDDPRSLMLRGVAQRLGGDKAAFATQVEQTVVDVLAELKPGRHLYANVEFYAGVVMDRCGLPRELFTPTFASSRVIGWCANMLEQAADNRIIRPSARYVGPPPPQPVPDPA
jgi:citrate synthase